MRRSAHPSPFYLVVLALTVECFKTVPCPASGTSVSFTGWALVS